MKRVHTWTYLVGTGALGAWVVPGVVSCPGIVAAKKLAEDVTERDCTKSPAIPR